MLKKHRKRKPSSDRRLYEINLLCQKAGIEINPHGPSFVNRWTLCPEPIDANKLYKKLCKEEDIKNYLTKRLKDTIFENNPIELVKDSRDENKIDIYLLNDKEFTPEQFDELLDKVWDLLEEFEEFDIDFHIRDV